MLYICTPTQWQRLAITPMMMYLSTWRMAKTSTFPAGFQADDTKMIHEKIFDFSNF